MAIVESIVLGATLVTSVAGIVSGLRRSLSHSKRGAPPSITIESADGSKLKVEADKLTPQQLEKLISALGKGEPQPSKESGSEGGILLEILLLVIPGLIALAFAATFIYLLVENQNNPDYATPKELSAAMTTIIGYYFGVGASSTMNQSETVTANDVARILDGHSPRRTR